MGVVAHTPPISFAEIWRVLGESFSHRQRVCTDCRWPSHAAHHQPWRRQLQRHLHGQVQRWFACRRAAVQLGVQVRPALQAPSHVNMSITLPQTCDLQRRQRHVRLRPRALPWHLRHGHCRVRAGVHGQQAARSRHPGRGQEPHLPDLPVKRAHAVVVNLLLERWRAALCPAAFSPCSGVHHHQCTQGLCSSSGCCVWPHAVPSRCCRVKLTPDQTVMALSITPCE